MIFNLIIEPELREVIAARVVNHHTHKDATGQRYIGRARSGEGENPWANPFSLEGCGGDRTLCLLRYLSHVQRTKLYTRTHELRDTALRCFCAPKDCHGHILARLAHEKTPKAAQATLQRMIAAVVESLPATMPLQLVACGSRHLSSTLDGSATVEDLERFEADCALVDSVLKRTLAQVMIGALFHGDCAGADRLFADQARHYTNQVFKRPALWKHKDGSTNYGAGPERNAALFGVADMIVGLWDGKTERSGTLDMIGHAWRSPDWICWQEPVTHPLIKSIYWCRKIDTIHTQHQATLGI